MNESEIKKELYSFYLHSDAERSQEFAQRCFSILDERYRDGMSVTDSTRKNLEMCIEAENGATMGKFELAKMAKELGLDAIHDTVHEMARDEPDTAKPSKDF